MAQSNDIYGMLDLMDRPGFCVRDQKIVKVNPAAELRMLPGSGCFLRVAHMGVEFTGLAGCGVWRQR